MIYQIGEQMIFQAAYVASGVAATSATVTVTIKKVTTSGHSEIVTDAAATEVGDGLYRYTMAANLNDAAGMYTAVFDTADTVDQRNIYMTNMSGFDWVENIDAAISTLATTLAAIVASIAALPAAVWAYATRTLTSSAASTAATVEGSKITVNKYDTLHASLTGIGSLANRTKLYFTVKRSPPAQSDEQADIHILLSNPPDAEEDGLLFINGTAGTKANGSIVVDDEDDGDITIHLEAEEVAKLADRGVEGYDYDVHIIQSGDNTSQTISSSKFTISTKPTRVTE